MIGIGVGVGEIASISDVEYAYILGSFALSVVVALGAVVDTFDGVSTLGDGVGGFGSFFTLLSASEIFYRALRVGSPTLKFGVFVESGALRMVIISVAACLKIHLSQPLELGYL